ncbi:MAG: Rrf2 family transcriptional regulator [Dysosmobacter sp.]|nr:Rrf2 family transcriptional regulator [Dysosmobacter sp.]
MQISSRFTIAVHVLLCIEMFKGSHKVTSDFLASSVNANPVVIRKLLLQLKAAGIIRVARGTGGADTVMPPGEITLLDVYNAVESLDGGELFRFHENPNPLCPVGRNIHAVLDVKLEEIQRAMEKKLGEVTLQDVLADTKRLLALENCQKELM